LKIAIGHKKYMAALVAVAVEIAIAVAIANVV
jgi:hypothetical protein